MSGAKPNAVLDRDDYELEVEDTFDGPPLNEALWVPQHLPQWSSRSASAARYQIRDGTLRLRIEADQAPWCPEFNGWLRVSSVQTGVFAGAVGSTIGQHRFTDGMVVREPQENVALYTPLHGLFEVRAKALDDPANMVALWMIGYEDRPQRSGEILVMEIFGRDVSPTSAVVGMGVRPHHDPALVDAFSQERLGIDVRDFHEYSTAWTQDRVAFYVDGRLVHVVNQSIDYPMQFMLGIYEFADGPEPASAPEGIRRRLVPWLPAASTAYPSGGKIPTPERIDPSSAMNRQSRSCGPTSCSRRAMTHAPSTMRPPR
jgi:hypothetical protein